MKALFIGGTGNISTAWHDADPRRQVVGKALGARIDRVIEAAREIGA